MAAADTPGGDTVKKRALVRLAIAGMVTTLALAGLWWLDRQGAEPPGAPPEAAPKPIVSAPQPEPPPPVEEEASVEEEAPAEPMAAAEAGPRVAPAPAGETVKAMMAPAAGTSERPAPPPPRVSNDAGLPPRAAAAPATQPPRAVVAAPSQPARQAKAVEQAADKPAGPRDFIVQLGVFSNPTYAQELVQRLNRQGIRAYTETRVLVGPFLNQREADKARAELARQGVKGVVSEAASQ